MSDEVSDATDDRRTTGARLGGGWTGSTRPSMAVVETVGEAIGRAPHELEPLYSCVDPDALDALFGPIGDGSRPAGRVVFTYAGCEVRVSGETVDVVPLDGSNTDPTAG